MVCLCEIEVRDMRTQSINNARNNNTNVIAAGVGGATAAALVTRYIPLSKAEHDDAFKPVAQEIQNKVLAAKNAQYERIADGLQNNKALNNVRDVFIKSKDIIIEGSKETLEEASKGLDNEAKSAFNTLVKSVADSGRLVEQFENSQVIKQAKKSRPALYFAALAGAFSMTAAVLKNVISARKAQNQTVGISYDKEGMIIDAPDSLSVAIILDEFA